MGEDAHNADDFYHLPSYLKILERLRFEKYARAYKRR